MNSRRSSTNTSDQSAWMINRSDVFDQVLVNLREFVKTHVILAPVREFSRPRAATEIPFPRARRAKQAKKSVLALLYDLKSQKTLCLFDIFWTHVSCKLYKSVLALPRDSNSQKTRCFVFL